MTPQTEILLKGLAGLGAAILTGAAPKAAGTFAIQAVIREVPHLIGLAAIALSTGKLTEEQRKIAHDQAVALSQGLDAIPAADAPPAN